jgi:hypothetical protein
MVKPYYKIYSRSLDMYLKGTPGYSRWDKEGRLFSSIAQLRSFMTATMNSRGCPNPIDTSDWEIREYTMTLLNRKDVMDVIKPEKIIELLKKDY